MSRIPSFPTIIDDTIKLTVLDVKKQGLLNVPDNFCYSKIVNWRSSRTNEITASISIKAYSDKIILDYNFRGEPKQIQIKLVRKQSNLNKGYITYFICPFSNKKCRILYSFNGVFSHRIMGKNALYESQTYSKKDRLFAKKYGDQFKIDRMANKYFDKYRKTHYKGKYTKWYAKLMSLERSNNYLKISYI